MLLTLAAILFLLCASAFFSGAEAALVAASRPHMQSLEALGNPRAALVNRLRGEIELVSAAVLLGNTVANILAAVLATGLLIAVLGEGGIVYAAIAATVLLLVLGEVVPKTIAINDADRIALAVAPVMGPVVAVSRPIVGALQVGARALLSPFGVRATKALGAASTEEELRGAIDLHAGSDVEVREASAMLHSILDLDQVPVADIMVHRRNVIMIDAGLPPRSIVAQVLASPYTRIPLWRDEPDNIVGVLHVKALLRAVQTDPAGVEALDVLAIAAPPWFIPDSTSLLDQLQAFRTRREHFALVVDEYGAFLGIVTLEDILEEIVGDIADETDVTRAAMSIESDGSHVLDGTTTIRDLNREFGWRLPDEEASTIAGLVLHEARQIPQPGQVFIFHGFRFEILDRQRNQIRSLRVTPLAPGERDSEPQAA